MSAIISMILIVVLSVFIIFLGSYLRNSFQASKKGLPPYLNTYPRQRYLFRKNLPVHKGSTILDLGCGDGTMLRLFEKEYGCKKAVGYDINNFAIRRGKFINKILGKKNITLIHDDLFRADLTGYDYVYLFLLPDFMEKVEPRLFERIDPETVVICNAFPFLNRQPTKIVTDKKGKERLFFYKK